MGGTQVKGYAGNAAAQQERKTIAHRRITVGNQNWNRKRRCRGRFVDSIAHEKPSEGWPTSHSSSCATTLPGDLFGEMAPLGAYTTGPSLKAPQIVGELSKK